MTSSLPQLDALAPLFRYPGDDYYQLVKQAVALCGSSAPGLVAFAREVEHTPLDRLQELYTSTFDLLPVCPLDLGWHLFGEEHDRGLLLTYLRRQMREHGIAELGELPDHLSRVLVLLPRMAPAKAEEFAAVIVAPALRRMLKCMPADNFFCRLLQAAKELINVHFPAAFEPVAAVAEGVAS